MQRVIIIVFLFLIQFHIVFSQDYALRFFGNGSGDIDRVKIPIDAPATPADVGNSFTVEFQIKAKLADNTLGSSVSSGVNDDWILGHTIVDRDIFGAGDYGDYGISLASGRIAFGINNGTSSYTLVTTTNVADNNWHHVAVTRNHSTGQIKIYIDGNLAASQTTSVTGDVSYRNGRSTTWVNDPYIVLGAEKHDYNPAVYPSFNGYLDEFRISNIVRYTASSYTPVSRFTDDANTVLLYHFDEGAGSIIRDSALIAGLPTHGLRMFGGSPLQGPIWVLKDTLTTSVPSFDDNEIFFNMYPNPSSKIIYAQSNRNIFKIQIYDALGNECIGHHNINCISYSIDIENLPNGIYFAHILFYDGRRYARKWIKV